MAKLKEFVIALAKKAGYDTESPASKPFFDALGEVDVPEDIHKGIDNALISITDAKNNHTELKNHYQAQSLAGIDSSLEELMKDFELDEPTKQQILAERSTYKRVPTLARTLVELERKKAATTGGKDKQEIQKQIDELHTALRQEKEGRAKEKTEYENQRILDRISTKKNVLFSGLKTIHDELDPEVRYNILDTLVSKALQDNKAKLVLDDNGDISIIRNDGTTYHGENHQQIKPIQFIEQTLAKNKQIKVTPTAGQNPGNNNNGQVHQPAATTGNGGNNGSNYNTLIDRNKQALAELEAADKNGPFGA